MPGAGLFGFQIVAVMRLILGKWHPRCHVNAMLFKLVDFIRIIGDWLNFRHFSACNIRAAENNRSSV